MEYITFMFKDMLCVLCAKKFFNCVIGFLNIFVRFAFLYADPNGVVGVVKLSFTLSLIIAGKLTLFLVR
jgi:hypothetical protein